MKTLQNITESAKPPTKSFLELLIESSGGDKGYTDLELQEETMVMLLAGTDTSAVGASFAAMMLSKHPEVQEKLHQE
jgi:cytochrome P450